MGCGVSLTADEIRAMRSASILGGARIFWALADEIAAEYGVTVKAICSKNRGRLDVNEARQFLCHHAMKRGISSGQIGRWLDRDHSTVLHAAKQAEAKLAAVALGGEVVLE